MADTVSLLFLLFLVAPLLAYLVYLVAKLFRRGKPAESEGTESEA